MAALVFKINNVDLIPYLKKRGIEWSRNDVDSESAGELQDGTVRRDRIIVRRKLIITTRNPLTTSEISTIQQLIYPVFVSVEFLDPLTGSVLTRTFYSNNVACTAAYDHKGEAAWEGFSFPLVEKGVPGEGAS